ncbi:MAG: transglutaminase domain-containing protein [Calditrichaeota bacterium]|nr:MAG: transglutaminase domain-containing protein [Calditrichota bacterium]
MKKITFTMKDVVPLETEELMPPENGLKTTLRLYPTFSRSYAYSTTAFGYNLFTFSVRPFATGLATYRFYEDKYWRELAEEWGEFWNVYSKDSKFIPDIIAKVVIAQDSKQQKMKKLYTYVQENFTNHDLVDDEEEKKNFTIPEKIDDLIDERYGNSWLINGLYAMLLRGIDIPATPVYLDDRDEVVFNEQNFKRNFARSVVMADTANHKFVYLSPALAYLPFGQVPWYLQNVVGVAADYRPNNRSMTSEYLVRTSRDKSSIVNIDLIDATIVINADNSADVEVLNSFKGQQNWIFKSSNRHNSDDEIKKTVADKYDKKYKGAKIVSFIVDNRDSTDAFSALRYNIHIPDFAVAIGKRIAFKPCFLDPPIEKLAAVEKRKYPVCFDYPHQQICTIKIIPPEGYQLEFTPADINIVTSQSSFLAQVIHSGREITYKDIFKVDEIEIHPLHFDNIKKVADAVQNSYSQELMLAAAN